MTQNGSMHDPIVLLQRVHRWRMAFFLLIILIAGAVIGASSMYIYQQKKQRPQRVQGKQGTTSSPKTTTSKATNQQDPPHLAFAKSLRTHLRLSEQQYQKLLPILRPHLQQLNKIKMEARPKIREELTAMNEKVLDLLNDNQKKKWRQDFTRMRNQYQLDYRPGSQAQTNTKSKTDPKKTTKKTTNKNQQQQQQTKQNRQNNKNTSKSNPPTQKNTATKQTQSRQQESKTTNQ